MNQENLAGVRLALRYLRTFHLGGAFLLVFILAMFIVLPPVLHAAVFTVSGWLAFGKYANIREAMFFHVDLGNWVLSMIRWPFQKIGLEAEGILTARLQRIITREEDLILLDTGIEYSDFSEDIEGLRLKRDALHHRHAMQHNMCGCDQPACTTCGGCLRIEARIAELEGEIRETLEAHDERVRLHREILGGRPPLLELLRKEGLYIDW